VRAAQLTGRKEIVSKSRPSSKARLPRHLLPGSALPQAAGKLKKQPFPERRKTNKFRESHVSTRLTLVPR
jgi:hypothetical protein